MEPNEARDRSYQLLGKLLNAYTQLEYELTWGILRVYGLQWAEGTILTAHIPFAGKGHSLRTAIEFFSRDCMSDEWRDETNEIFGKVLNVVKRRNHVAHTYSDATADGDILFTKVSAFEKYAEKETIMTSSQVDAEFEAVTDLAATVAHLVSELCHRDGQYLQPREPNGMLSLLTPLRRAGKSS